MDGPPLKTIVKTFESSDRETLEREVNQFISNVSDAIPNIWCENHMWYASVTYKEAIQKKTENGFLSIQF